MNEKIKVYDCDQSWYLFTIEKTGTCLLAQYPYFETAMEQIPLDWKKGEYCLTESYRFRSL